MQDTDQKVKSEPTAFRKAYDDLSETKKALLRIAFKEHFDYRSMDTFYKKMNAEEGEGFKKLEKEWLSVKMNIPQKELFPTAI